ncbi:Phosphatase [Meiothermus luteus]|jgi:REG-2-like HAD superfamily hydrolase|uniref:Phosphatase n=1 Tax=Meiothermus luteus TaxID=2026184 RepID=A0A399ESQ6_9DEIN|nr:HAD-IA family hydrolase [Meiothermus luteus]RIH86540.1 Phosphatase [Meiothermus luteus]RMH54362.1 MAG: HAD family hydrolase [Deinococcota bacterium]
MIRAVLFDVGDTLILGHPRLWLWPLLKERGLEAKADLARLPQATRQAYQHYAEHHMQATDEATALSFWRTFHREIMRGIGLEEHAEEVADYLAQNWQSPHIWPLAPGAKEVLGELKRLGLRLGVVSNWDWTLPGVLRATGLADFFDYIGASALLGVAKPDPRFFSIVLDKLGVEPAEALHVGDSEDDIQGAQAAGVTPVLFDAYGQHPTAIRSLSQVVALATGKA